MWPGVAFAGPGLVTTPGGRLTPEMVDQFFLHPVVELVALRRGDPPYGYGVAEDQIELTVHHGPNSFWSRGR